MSTPANSLAVHSDFVTGMDAGGTKILAVDNRSLTTHRFPSQDYTDMYTVLEAYFTAAQARPRRVVIAMAGPRDDETGDVHPTNLSWPVFSPNEAARRYPGTEFITVHDLAGAAAGALHATSIDLHTLKSGKAVNNGPIITVTISTGVGICTAIWDAKAKRRVLFSGEGGHIGFQPRNEAERRHLAHIHTKHAYPSVELAISGKHGIESWIEHSPELTDAHKLKAALDRAIEAGRPAGAVLLEFATEGSGADRDAAHNVLANIGVLVGNVLADLALAYRSTGGIYLTGSVALGLGEYWAEQTDFTKTFVRHGTPEHAAWLEPMLDAIPIYLITNPEVGAAGALVLAKED